MILAAEFELGPQYFKTYIADLVSWPESQNSYTWILRAGGTEKPALESKVKYLSFCKSWSNLGSPSKSLHLKLFSTKCLVLLSSWLRTFHHSFHGIVKNDSLLDNFEVEL